MTKYEVYIEMTVSAVVDVEADSIEQALESYFESSGMPSSIGHGAFGQVAVDEAGDWEPKAVSVGGEEVWSLKSTLEGLS